MEKLTLLFEEFILKAIVLTEKMLAMDFAKEDGELATFTDNRERLLTIVGQIAGQIDWNEVPGDRRDELNRQIEFIKKLDVQLLTKLQEFKEELKQNIEKTHRSKENIKGYNLNDVK